MPPRLKVLFLTSWYPNSTNPMHGVFIREHARAVNLLDDVTVIHCIERSKNTHLKWQLIQEKDPALTQEIPTYRLYTPQMPFPGITYPMFLLSTLTAYNRFYKSNDRPDVIHAHIYRAGVPAVLLGKIHQIPVVITEHNSAFPRRLLPAGEIRKARFAFKNAQYVLPVSKALQNGIESYGIHANFQIIPNAVESNLFFPPDSPHNINEPKRFLFTGSLKPVKGLQYLLDALSVLNKSSISWHLDVVGDGPERSKYEEQSQMLGLSGNVTFHGYQPKAKISRLMREADYFVLPSLWENQPCVLSEALTCGLPIISTITGGIPEMVDEHTGILVPLGDSTALAESLLKALNNELQFDQRYIKQAADKYRQEVVGKAIHDVYESVLTFHK